MDTKFKKKGNRSRIVCIFNYAPHYRKSIYNLMAKEFCCDFFFGFNLPNGGQLKKMDLASLPGFKKESKVFRFHNYIWQCNVFQQAFKGYQIYVLTGNPSISNIFLLALVKIFRKKVFLWMHGLKNIKEGKHPLVRFFFQNATGYFLYGNYGKEMMIKYGIPENRLFVINNSLDYDRQLEVRNHLTLNSIYVEKFKNNDPVLIFTGRLQGEKKINYLLEVQRKLELECPFNLVLVGDGPEEAKLRQIVDELRLSNRVWFYGACYDEKVLGELFYNATLTVSPGNVGLTAIHSMMYGTPVLTHDNSEHQGPEYEAVKQGETGLFFKENDKFDLSEKIKFWIQTYQNRNEIRRRCFDMVDNFYNPYYQIKIMKQIIDD